MKNLLVFALCLFPTIVNAQMESIDYGCNLFDYCISRYEENGTTYTFIDVGAQWAGVENTNLAICVLVTEKDAEGNEGDTTTIELANPIGYDHGSQIFGSLPLTGGFAPFGDNIAAYYSIKIQLKDGTTVLNETQEADVSVTPWTACDIWDAVAGPWEPRLNYISNTLLLQFYGWTVANPNDDLYIAVVDSLNNVDLLDWSMIEKDFCNRLYMIPFWMLPNVSSTADHWDIIMIIVGDGQDPADPQNAKAVSRVIRIENDVT